MSLEFSRRSFLKYTAVAAVAVAGSSLLTGCKDEDATKRTGTGELTVLQSKANLSEFNKNNDNQLEFTFSVKNGHDNSMAVDANCFKVEVTHDGDDKPYFKGANSLGKLKISEALYNDALKNDATASGTVTTIGLTGLKDGDTIVFTYRPSIYKYNKYRAEWTLTYKENTSTGSDSGSGDANTSST